MMRRIRYSLLCLCCLLCAASSLHAADTLRWRAKEDRVDAEINNCPLPQLLAKIAKASGWHVFVEPGTTYSVSAKFKNLTKDEALRRLLGRINFSLVRTNAVSSLYIYQTEARAATQLVPADKKGDPKDYLIQNELVVRLKKDSKISIEELAKLTGATILGRDDELKIYRLEFPDEAATKAAKELLNNNSSVAWVDSNYSVDRPVPQQMAAATMGSEFSLDPKPTSDCSPIVGLIDTAIQTQPGFTNYVMPSISVVGDVTIPTDSPTHGTAMLETMLKAMSSSPAKVLPVTVYKNGEDTTTYEVAQGIVKAINAGANPINLSLGGTGDSPFLRQLILEASQKGIVFIAAAGNEPVKTPTYPAAWPGVVAVTAADPNGHIAPYANSGEFVQAMAPGTSIVSLNGQLWQMQGTSVSTANVSGMLAARATRDCISPSKLTDQVIAGLPVK